MITITENDIRKDNYCHLLLVCGFVNENTKCIAFKIFD